MKPKIIIASAIGVLTLMGLAFTFGFRSIPKQTETYPRLTELPTQIPVPPAALGASGNKSCTTTFVSISRTTSTAVLAANTARRSVNLVNTSGTTVFVKRGTGVTSSTGLPLTALGSSWSWDEVNDPYTLAVSAISPDATSTLAAETCQ